MMMSGFHTMLYICGKQVREEYGVYIFYVYVNKSLQGYLVDSIKSENNNDVANA